MALVKYHKPVSNLFNTPSLFDEFYKQFDQVKKFDPNINLSENDNGYNIEVSLPGFKKEDVGVKLEQNKLKIFSKTSEEKEETTDKYFRKEFTIGSFERVFQLPQKANLETVQAIHENGVLKIHIPKAKEEIYTKTIEIQ